MKERAALHEGHRDRLRQRFMNEPDKMPDHELLELLLFYVIPRRDTNDLAHTLIENFGSLVGVIESDEVLLSHVTGVKSAAVVYLKALCELARRYAAHKLSGHGNDAVFDTPEKIAGFIWPRFMGLTEERVYALLFDNGMHLLDCFHVCDGSVAGAPLSVRRIVQHAYNKGAVGVVLAHNHPRGVAIPSGEDIRVTRRLDEALRMMEISLIEHYVFSDQSFAPIMSKCRAGGEREYVASPLSDILQESLSLDQKEDKYGR